MGGGGGGEGSDSWREEKSCVTKTEAMRSRLPDDPKTGVEMGGGGGSWELTAATTLTRSFPHSCRGTAAVQVVQRPRLRGRH